MKFKLQPWQHEFHISGYYRWQVDEDIQILWAILSHKVINHLQDCIMHVLNCTILVQVPHDSGLECVWVSAFPHKAYTG